MRVGVFDGCRCSCLPLSSPVAFFDHNIGRTVVKHLDHLRFVKWQIMMSAFSPLIAAKFEVVLSEPPRITEVFGIVGLVKHGLKSWIFSDFSGICPEWGGF